MTLYSATDPSVIVAAQRAEEALRLRLTGLSYRGIARTMGVGLATAHDYIAGALAEQRAINQERAAEVRELELARCDALMLELWPQRQHPRAVDSILRVMERRAKLLGLDAPQRLVLPGVGGNAPAEDKSWDLSQLPAEDLRAIESLYDRMDRLGATPQKMLAEHNGNGTHTNGHGSTD